LYARLEQLVKTEQEEFFSLIETQSTRIDHYETLVTALYTGHIKKKFNPIGTFSDFELACDNEFGPGIMEKIRVPGISTDFISRFRKDNDLPSHLNNEFYVSEIGNLKKKKELSNTHIWGEY